MDAALSLTGSMAAYSLSKKNPYSGFLTFFPNGWEFLINFFYTFLYYPFYTRLQISIHLLPTSTKLPHTERDHPANFYISLKTLASKFAYWANDVIVDVVSYPTCLLTL